VRRWRFLGLALGLGLGVAVAGASPATALSIFTLPLVAPSAITPSGGPAEPLAGSLTIAIGSLPLVANTSLQLTDVSVATSGGATFALDPDVPSAGLGVLHPDGSFLIPTLFLRVDVGSGPEDLAIPNVTGTTSFSGGGTTLVGLDSSFDVDSPAGPLAVRVVAAPEPATICFVAVGLVAVALRGARKEFSR
jgi:hypothetical protein